jgi:hypothetical protein
LATLEPVSGPLKIDVHISASLPADAYSARRDVFTSYRLGFAGTEPDRPVP